MVIGVLTSSRADYSIYFPLLKRLKNESGITLSIIAFGTHLLPEYGVTVNNIIADGFRVGYKVDTAPTGDLAENISAAMGKTMTQFAPIWATQSFDLLLALGDRYEMFAACASSVPFNIPIAHIHGGESTVGAIDNIFRHSITHMATLHFTAAEQYKQKVITLKGSDQNVYNVGALSIDNLSSLQLMSVSEFEQFFNIDLSKPSILITFHPETVAFEKNKEYVDELIGALRILKNYQLIITMPNADTMGSMIREKLNVFISETPNAVGVESFGTIGYLTCMKYCVMLLGNTSSGFIEASFFPKYVINLGKRQSGRIMSDNICNVPIEKNAIVAAVNAYGKKKLPESISLYGDGNAAEKITSIIKYFYL
jgi:GDP/UDP-N,N'-diacetylbacillosamine 2-epimerase (hydrolysing)